MNSYRKTAIVVGALFLVATVAGVASVALSFSILADSDYLTKINENETLVITGAVLELIMAVSIAGIAIAVYPVIRKHNAALALGYVGARILEGVLFVVSALSLMLLLTLSREFVKGEGPDISYFQTSGALLLAARDWIGNAIAPTFAFGLSMVIFYYVLYQSKLIPRWLSVWGLVGMPLYIAAGLSAMFGGGSMPTAWSLLFVPIAVNEMVLAVWFIVKGFNSSAIASLYSKTEIADA